MRLGREIAATSILSIRSPERRAVRPLASTLRHSERLNSQWYQRLRRIQRHECKSVRNAKSCRFIIKETWRLGLLPILEYVRQLLIGSSERSCGLVFELRTVDIL